MRVLGSAAIGALIVASCASKSSDITPAYVSPVRAHRLRGTSAGGSNGRSRNGRASTTLKRKRAKAMRKRP
jgi:hypothetical protein